MRFDNNSQGNSTPVSAASTVTFGTTESIEVLVESRNSTLMLSTTTAQPSVTTTATPTTTDRQPQHSATALVTDVVPEDRGGQSSPLAQTNSYLSLPIHLATVTPTIPGYSPCDSVIQEYPSIETPPNLACRP